MCVLTRLSLQCCSRLEALTTMLAFEVAESCDRDSCIEVLLLAQELSLPELKQVAEWYTMMWLDELTEAGKTAFLTDETMQEINEQLRARWPPRAVINTERVEFLRRQEQLQRAREQARQEALAQQQRQQQQAQQSDRRCVVQ